VQAKVLGMAHDWGRLKHGAVHHGPPPSKNSDYRSTPTSFWGLSAVFVVSTVSAFNFVALATV